MVAERSRSSMKEAISHKETAYHSFKKLRNDETKSLSLSFRLRQRQCHPELVEGLSMFLSWSKSSLRFLS